MCPPSRGLPMLKEFPDKLTVTSRNVLLICQKCAKMWCSCINLAYCSPDEPPIVLPHHISEAQGKVRPYGYRGYIIMTFKKTLEFRCNRKQRQRLSMYVLVPTVKHGKPGCLDILLFKHLCRILAVLYRDTLRFTTMYIHLQLFTKDFL